MYVDLKGALDYYSFHPIYEFPANTVLQVKHSLLKSLI